MRVFVDGGDVAILCWREVCWSRRRGKCEWERVRGDGLGCRICDQVLWFVSQIFGVGSVVLVLGNWY